MNLQRRPQTQNALEPEQTQAPEGGQAQAGNREESSESLSAIQETQGNAAALAALRSNAQAPEAEVEQENAVEAEALGTGGQAAGAPPPDGSAPSAPSGPPGAPGGSGGPTGPPEAPTLEAAELAGEDASEVVAAYRALGSSEQAATYPELGPKVDEKAKEAEEEHQANLPELTVEMVGEQVPPSDSAEVASTPFASSAGQDAPGATPEPQIEPTPELGAFQDGFSAGDALSGLSTGEGADTSGNAGQIGHALSSMPTTDASLITSAGPRPVVPTEGVSDPARVSQASSTASQESSEGLQAAQAAIQESPGSELVQPTALQEAAQPEGLQQVAVDAPGEVQDMTEFVELGLAPDVQGAFDELSAAKFDASVADMQAQVDTAAATRDADRDAALADAEAQQTALTEQAHADQTAVVQEQRSAIEAERESTMAQQAEAVAGVRSEIDSERAAQLGQIDGRIASEREAVDARFAQAESQASAEVRRGEQEAERERRAAEREAEDRSWWEEAVDVVSDALSAVADAISSIMDAVRSAVSAILDAAKTWAEAAISAAVQWISEAIASFSTWLQDRIQALLGDLLPGLADALCAFVNAAAQAATAAIERIASGLLAAFRAMCDVFEAALNAVLDAYQAGLNAALAVANALISGDWMAFLLMAIEAALQLAGIPPEQFYGLIGRAEDTIKDILADPGSFVSNLIDALSMGFGQFSDNFLTHLQGGFLDWITGAIAGTGLVMPAAFDLAGVFDITTQVLGITAQRIREKAVEYIGERNVGMIEHVWGMIEHTIEGGIGALWGDIQNYLGNLWQTVVGGIQDWLMTRVVMAAVTKLATMFNPVGALVNALITVWNIYNFVTEQARRIMGLVTAVVDGMAGIVAGNLSQAANLVERSLAGLVPVAISLLANLLGLSGIGEKVREIIERVQEAIWNAIESLIERVKGLFRGSSDSDSSDSDAANSDAAEGGTYDGQIGEERSFSAGNEQHRLWVQDNGGGAATVMVASTPMSIDDRLNNWTNRLGDPPSSDHGVGGPGNRSQAEQDIATARTQAETVKTVARQAASAGDDAQRAEADGRTEQAEAALAPTLQALFNNFQDVNFSATLEGKLLGPDKAILPGYLEADGLTVEEAGTLDTVALQSRGRAAWRRDKGDDPTFLYDVAAQIGDAAAGAKLREIDAERAQGAIGKTQEVLAQVVSLYTGSMSRTTDALMACLQTAARTLRPMQRPAQVQPSAAPQVQLWGFRGVREVNGEKVKEMAEDDPRKADIEAITHEHHLLFAGHVGISLDNGATVYGLTPSKPEGMTGAMLIDHLYNHTMTFPGVVADDKYVFELADRYAMEKGWNTELSIATRSVSKQDQANYVQQLQQMIGVAPGAHGIYYSFPLSDAENGSYFKDTPGPSGAIIKGQDQSNCATFPQFIGVELPEQSGNLRYYMPALAKLAAGEN